MELSRRSFVASAAAATGALAATSAVTAFAEEAAPAVEHAPVSEEDADIVVVGSGTAGICAATRAAELGAKVILLEKRGILGGSSGFAEGVGGINSYLHKQQGIEIDLAEVFQRAQEYHHWAANSAVLKNFIAESGPTIDWLHENCGVDFCITTVVSATSYPSWHLANDMDGNLNRISESLIAPLELKLEELGADVRKDSPATGLVVEDGAVKGVYWTDGSNEYQINAPAVVLATGGYSNNKEMLEEFTHQSFDRMHNWGVEGRDGDGIRWAHEIGGEYHIVSTMMGACTAVPEPTVFEEPLNWMFSWQPNMRINQDGKRFFCEAYAADFCVSTNAIMAESQCFSIMDQGYVDMIANEALPFGMASVGYVAGVPMPGAAETVAAAVEAGRLLKADTVAVLAEKMGAPAETLVATIEKFNADAAAGADAEYGMPPEMLRPYDQPPYYAAPIQPGCFTSVGGLNVDVNFRVLRSDSSFIEGLYALGGDESSDTGRDYDVGVFAGSQQGWCATGGRLVAEQLFA